MKKRLINGVEMPMLGLGTYLVNDEKIAYKTFEYALEIGYRHIDTAQMYNNEHIVGKALSDSLVPREQVFITTKQKGHSTKDKMRQAFYDSLEKLGTDYIDLYLIHWPNRDERVNQQTWALFEELYEAKKVRAIGVSNFAKHHLTDLAKTAKIMPMVNQIEMHPGLTQINYQTYLEKQNIAIESYGPFMRGGVFKGEMAEELTKIAEKHQRSIAQVVIAWGLKRGIIMIPKSVTLSRIKENFAAQQLKLTEAEVETINALNGGKRLYPDPDNTPYGEYLE